MHSPPHGAQRLSRHVVNALSVEDHLSGCEVKQPQDGAPDGGLAASRLAHQCQCLRFVDMEGHAVNRIDPSPMRKRERSETASYWKIFLEIIDLEQRDGHAATVALGAKWHAATWNGALTSRAGARFRHTSLADGQRLAKTQPAMRSFRSGTTPGISTSLTCRRWELPRPCARHTSR